MVERIVLATIVAVLETLIIIGLNLGVYNARKLKINWHHFWIYSSYTAQLLIFLIWMLPAAWRGYPFIVSSLPRTWLVLTHFVIGLIVGILATFLVGTYIFFPEINIAKLKKTKPIMQTVYVLWTLNYLIGVYNYINRYWLTS